MFCYEQVQSCLFRHWFSPPEPWSFLCCSLFLRSQIIWNEEIKRGLVTTDVNRCFLKKLLCSILHRFSFDQFAAFWQPISTSLDRQLHVHKTEPRPQRLISHKLQLRESIRDITEQIRAKYTLSRNILLMNFTRWWNTIYHARITKRSQASEMSKDGVEDVNSTQQTLTSWQ